MTGSGSAAGDSVRLCFSVVSPVFDDLLIRLSYYCNRRFRIVFYRALSVEIEERFSQVTRLLSDELLFNYLCSAFREPLEFRPGLVPLLHHHTMIWLSENTNKSHFCAFLV